jgi:hypothetical protein
MKKILVWLVVAIFPCLILLGTAYANINWMNEARLAKVLVQSGVEVTASVVDTQTYQSIKTYSTSTMTYRFTPVGQTKPISATRPVDAGTFQRLKGKTTFPIRYLVSDPQNSDIAGNDMAFFAALYAVILDLIVAFGFGAALYAARKQRKA